MIRFLIFVLIIPNTVTKEASKESQYGYQTGHISLNDSEITILINSTFEIIEDYENETDVLSAKSSTVPPRPSTTLKTKKPRLRKIKPSKLSSCQKYSEEQKYKMLEEAGGRNQMFMADSIDEAAKNFAETYPESVIDMPAADHIDPTSSKNQEDCDYRCKMIKNALNSELQRRSNASIHRFSKRPVFSDAPMITGCSLGNFVPVGLCTDLGETVNVSFESLCSECHGLYMLNDNCFPKFFNAIRCNPQEMGCIFDSFTDMAHGQCGMQELTFKVLRNNGDDNCEDWVVEQILLPVACQCALSRNSFLHSRPPKEL
ncbi:unnamed protein product [Caenorhabditis bovis]|uniref:Uncharacterized protein n=1 Tax=Caenorhabditis bovis TaxID=2654633 RepID=A0A8S1E9U7_9PELO|nr:unnamed protein product [Caenorhabditis bovis]